MPTNETYEMIEAKFPQSLVGLPELFLNDGNHDMSVRFLWHCDYYDGPKSGLCIVNNQKYWFELVHEIEFYIVDRYTGDHAEGRRYRFFVVLQLTQEQIDREESEHKLFQEHVGTHTDYDENGNRAIGMVKPREGHDMFYKRERPLKDNYLETCQKIGWFLGY